jgi:hypothetical protein
MIQGAISEVQQSLKNDNVNNKRIKFMDINPVFEGHRFCEKGDSNESGWPEFTDRAWFFSSPYRSDILPSGTKVVPRQNDGSPKLELDRRDDASCADPYYQWDCALGRLQARDPGMKLNEKEYPRDFELADFLSEAFRAKLMKAFHPKTIAYDAIAKKIAQAFDENSAIPIPEDPQDPQNPQDTMDYFVWPEDGRDSKQVEVIASNLQRYLKNGAKLEASNTKTLGLNYWRMPSLTVSEALEISNLTDVRNSAATSLCCPLNPNILTIMFRSPVLMRTVAAPALWIQQQQPCTRKTPSPTCATYPESLRTPTIGIDTISTKVVERASKSILLTQVPT